MEFLKTSYIDTTTAIVVNSNSLTANNIMGRNLSFQYYSDGFNNDTTTTTIRINFSSTLTVSRIAFMGANVKSMTWFYNGTTANTFSFTTTAATTTSDFSTNSATSMYFQCTPVACTSVSFDLKSTMVANSEKAVGYIYIGQEYLDFPRIPASKNYKPILDPKDVTHELSDGSIRIHTVDVKHSLQIKFQNIEQSFRDDLKEVYDLRSEFVFVGFGTSTGWDGFMFPCVWEGPFQFYEYSDDFVQAGFSGSIKLRETSS